MCIEATQQVSVLPAMHAGMTVSDRSPRGRARCANIKQAQLDTRLPILAQGLSELSAKGLCKGSSDYVQELY